MLIRIVEIWEEADGKHALDWKTAWDQDFELMGQDTVDDKCGMILVWNDKRWWKLESWTIRLTQFPILNPLALILIISFFNSERLHPRELRILHPAVRVLWCNMFVFRNGNQQEQPLSKWERELEEHIETLFSKYRAFNLSLVVRIC